jgi:subtilisin family serine protease
MNGMQAETTGRFLVTLEDHAIGEAEEVLGRTMGIKEAVSASETGEMAAAEQPAEQALVFDQLGVAVVNVPPSQAEEIGATAQDEAIAHIEPERVVYTCHAPASAGNGAGDFTWGLQAIGIEASAFSGNGIEVAVLDTGVASTHPELSGRTVQSQSFVAGESVEDGHGHGTHCIGTACGSRGNGIQPRYGVAPEALIFAGKVLNNKGRGVDADILAGIEAAVARGSRVVSMSLGAPTLPGQPYSEAFEKAALRARGAGTLIVAAAGNDSRRPGEVRTVSHPANCPSILAVAAIDEAKAVAPFSNGSETTPLGGSKVDIAAPGVNVYSMIPMPGGHGTKSGTSMATPHVAGVAALLAEANNGATPDALATLLTSGATALADGPSDIGAGLVKAP